MLGNINIADPSSSVYGTGTFAYSRNLHNNNLVSLRSVRQANYDTYNNIVYKKNRAKNIIGTIGLGILAAFSIVSLKKNAGKIIKHLENSGSKMLDKIKKLFGKKGATTAADATQEAAKKKSFFSKIADKFKKKKN